jgi:hypothetical protein
MEYSFVIVLMAFVGSQLGCALPLLFSHLITQVPLSGTHKELFPMELLHLVPENVLAIQFEGTTWCYRDSLGTMHVEITQKDKCSFVELGD